MHRRRTKLAARTLRLTEQIGTGSRLVRSAQRAELRGVVTTYELHDRLLGNPLARRHHRRHPPRLDDVQRRILGDLEARDYAVLPFADLFSAETLDAVRSDGESFVVDADQTGDRDTYKDYLVRRYPRVSEVSPGSPWVRCCLSDRLLALADAYLGMWAKLEYIDYWYSAPVHRGSKRVQSQRWHRDFDDRHLLKAFLYLVDVDAETGPLEFVSGSARGGTMADFYPWRPCGQAYPPGDEFEHVVPIDDIRTFTACEGTLVLCNTSGFHRGGFATAKPRVLATATYCSPASLKSLTERNFRLPAGAAQSLTEPQRYAVT